MPRQRPVHGINKVLGILTLGFLAAAGVINSAQASDRMVSDAATVRTNSFMAATANPLATEAAVEVLRAGGSAVDAAIAVQMVLTLVEPQSSGIGGGGFLMYYAAATHDVIAYDGREKAPASATETMFLKPDGDYKGWDEAVVGGLSVGVPGVVRMLEMAHQEHGKLPWSRLFQPAISLARAGFPVTERMNYLSAGDSQLKTFADTAAYFFQPGGDPHPVGTVLTNPALAETLARIAAGGADAFYTGDIAEGIARTVQNAALSPTEMTMEDMAAYTAVKRQAVCGPYRAYIVCGMPPPSSGGITTLQILGILEHYPLKWMKPGSLMASHLIAEASRLAFADRNHYLADSDFEPHPPEIIDPDYLKTRAALIDLGRAAEKAEPGKPGSIQKTLLAPDNADKGLSTTHFSIVDAAGNVVSMTSSIETQFGSRLMTQGFLLNNQLTDFAWKPKKDGKPVANRPAPHKRPRSSMSPTIVFNQAGQPVLAVGSPGGSSIIGYVAKTLIGVLDWNLNIQQAIDLPHVLNKNGATRIEKGTPLGALIPSLEAMGHSVDSREMVSGLQGIAITPDGLEGGADPRREGSVDGD